MTASPRAVLGDATAQVLNTQGPLSNSPWSPCSRRGPKRRAEEVFEDCQEAPQVAATPIRVPRTSTAPRTATPSVQRTPRGNQDLLAMTPRTPRGNQDLLGRTPRTPRTAQRTPAGIKSTGVYGAWAPSDDESEDASEETPGVLDK